MCQINLVTVVLWNQVEAILEDSHHAKAKQVDLDDAEVSTILLVPLHDCSAWHGRTFQRHNAIQTPLADNHAAGMLTKMARQILDAHT